MYDKGFKFIKLTKARKDMWSIAKTISYPKRHGDIFIYQLSKIYFEDSKMIEKRICRWAFYRVRFIEP